MYDPIFIQILYCKSEPITENLQPMDQCPMYRENIAAQNGPDTEMTKFRDTEMFQKLLTDVTIRLGFAIPPFQPLDYKIVLDIYEMCRFDKAWYPLKPSAWCAVSNLQFAKFELNTKNIYTT